MIRSVAQQLMSVEIMNLEISKSAELKPSEFAETNVGHCFLTLDNENHVCYTLCQFENNLPYWSALQNIQLK